MWHLRHDISKILEYLEADKDNKDRLAVASGIYFFGEVESDGVIEYLCRRELEDLDALRLAAEIVESRELKQALVNIDSVIASLPPGENLADRIMSYVDQTDEDPFDDVNRQIVDVMPLLEEQLTNCVHAMRGV